ncbi:MAG: tRNA 5-methylaminomethyl-2-thiouridine biosynthesis bifunctional protein MnmC [Rhodocyclaceae bacterium]|nr:MAG: bifunctional tRNA (5-methylaminomethyl-2-thiouridine)(34)-methyltransferase MnmD/FAD-dependent 5-carboxymethylaminomethyl-2-thiouridine(34) oxidoreductase MnmC [Rhodocyclaceae bacterium]MBE7422470.1 bifunctional tRNA (5-methylaminomethyl-2-thiouridine)(34)-methyltransferase MnmD/FAD-dependent 5-carboxymethylaminomethyl-2-thiouridine(34) oxidoreductase MnmC [Zoogloeaceae bacterium]MBV6408084.1 tRNA 5-methylaminomethyl-2-thiouridine biosynthesis bifunctional protein MnmC [Rhodocyclaceae bac
MQRPIEPAAPAFQDGAAYSEAYGDIYWSLDGGLDETRHVFLSGNDLPARWQARRRFTILETGFGTGLNLLCAWQLFRKTAPAGARLHYLSVDKHPLRRDDLAALYRNWPVLAPLGAELLERYPPLVPGFHRLHLDGGRIALTLLFGEAAEMLEQVEARVDAFFLDGFAPARNPDMWDEALFAQIGRLAAPGATCATYSAAGKVSRGMAAAGFAVEKKAGFGRKREMLTGRFGGMALSEAQRERRALVVGGGIAGCLVAERLAARGWIVDLIERREGLARETSGNPAGVLQPVPSADGNRLSRLTLAGFHYALRRLQDFSADPQLIWQQCGVLRLARDTKQVERQRCIAESGLLPEDVLRWVDLEEASRLAGWRVPAPGWWFPQGAWVHPPALCDAALRAAGEAVRLHTQREVADLVRTDKGWRAVDSAGNVLAEAPVAVLANGHLARRLAVATTLPLRPVRGQITCIPAEPGRAIKAVVSREGYVTPATSFGVHVVGATYEEGATDTLAREEDHCANLERLRNLLPDFAARVDAARVAGRAGIRCVGPDRLPLVGAIPGDEGLYGLLGLGSRGLVYAPLCAELLACGIEGEALPIERDLAAGLAPSARLDVAP